MKAYDDLYHLAKCLVAPGKGILAADESLPTIGKRFQYVRVKATVENRRDYRRLLLSFSYGRALQEAALREWAGDHDRSAVAQEILLHRARCNSLARFGRYTDAMEHE